MNAPSRNKHRAFSPSRSKNDSLSSAGTLRGLREPDVGLYPFWFWNGDQQEDELVRQVRLFHESGCKGMAIHARTGNRTPYLSERWFALVRLTCEEARRLGLKVWIYDEEGYPSGNAGGRVQKENPEFVQKSLLFGYGPSDPANPAFAAFDPGTWESVDETAVPPGTELLRFRHIRFDRHVDTFHPGAGKCFVQLTHEKYAEHLSEFFGNVIQAFYTDDEAFTMGFGKIPWSEHLESEWSRRYGDSIRSHLAQLVEDIPGCGDVRVRFYALAQELFLRHFITPQKDWSESHGLIYTGHLCYDEGSLRIEVSGYGSSMPYYRLETIPAIDDFLCDLPSQRYLDEPFTGTIKPGILRETRFAPLMLYKKVSSVSHQYAHDLLSAEVLTFLGWKLTPEYEDKQMLFELAMGVNLITPHAFYYTFGRGTVNDCPPSYFFQQPYFPFEHAMFANWTRIAGLLRRGTFHAPLLLLRNRRLAALQNGGKVAFAYDSDSKFEPRTLSSAPDLDAVERLETHTVLRLHRAHFGFDFGDESFLPDDASVTPDGRFQLGNMTYSAVMLPPLDDLDPATIKLLARLRKKGGTVLPHGLFRGLSPDLDLRGEGSEEILVHARDTEAGREYFLVNLSGKTLFPEVHLDRPLDLYDPATDRVAHSGTAFPRDFEFPDGSAFFLLTPGVKTERIPFERSVFAKAEKTVTPSFVSSRLLRDNIYAAVKANTLEFTLEDGASVHTLYCEDMDDHVPSVDGKPLTLDRTASHPADPCYTGTKVSFGPGRHRIEFPKTRHLLALAGQFRVCGNVLRAPDASFAEGDLAVQGAPSYWGEIEYRYTFSGRVRRLELDLTAGAAQVSVNGIDCGVITGKPFRLDIAEACRDGENELLIRFANTNRNFATSEHAAYGIHAVRLS